MAGCRICGGLTRRWNRLCASCGAELGAYQTLDSGAADLPIPVRRYGCAPAAAPGEPPPQAPARPRRLVLVLACAGAAVGAVALALLAPW